MSRAERCTACDELRRQLEETRRQVPHGTYTCEWRWEEEIRTLTQQRDEARAELAALRAKEPPPDSSATSPRSPRG